MVKLELGQFWGKTKGTKDGNKGSWNPLLFHLIDVASCAEAILLREPHATRVRMAEIFGLEWDQALPWIKFVIACHDVGKVNPGFQLKSDINVEPPLNPPIERPIGMEFVHHGFVSQIALREFLINEKQNWPQELAEKVSDAIGCHHGERAGPTFIDDLDGNYRKLGKKDCAEARNEIFRVLIELFQPTSIPKKTNLSGPDFMLLAGLTSFADWIGSNEEWFTFGTPEDTEDLKSWMISSKTKAQLALDKLGWHSRDPLSKKEASFEEVFKRKPRPLQAAISHAVKEISKPAIILIEAPMGEGKTEAAFYAHLELQRNLGHRGLYIALPTKATGNAMFERTCEFLHSQKSTKSIDIQLLHGASLLNEEFQKLRPTSICSVEGQKGKEHEKHDGPEGKVRAGEWFTHKKRALLSEYGVGTIDQALLSVLPVKHQFVRLWGLANRVVVFDEIHAYDDYTGTLLIYMLRWLVHLNSSVILLSATLPPSIRNELARNMGAEIENNEAPYPRISIFQQGNMSQIPFEADPSRRCVLKLEGISEELSDLKNEMEKRLISSGMGLILVNTVDRAQMLYKLFPEGELIKNEKGAFLGKVLPDGSEILLFHARFPADNRQQREKYIVSVFGTEDKLREGKKILIATQVVEQSLDLDFDCIITDLAPIDLVLQRAGRLWRHQRSKQRPVPEPVLLIAGLKGESPPAFGQPLWWDKVYREDILLRTWFLLKSKTTLTLPDEIDSSVKTIYDEKEEMPDCLQERLDKALQDSQGVSMTHKIQARKAIIGYPEDASWDKPENFTKYDEDEAGLHPTLIAQTRLGEPSVVAIPIYQNEHSQIDGSMNFSLAKTLYLRAVALSRKSVVEKLQSSGIPNNWKKSPLLRNCYPLKLNETKCWIEDSFVRLDDELGVVYEPKEKK